MHRKRRDSRREHRDNRLDFKNRREDNRSSVLRNRPRSRDYSKQTKPNKSLLQPDYFHQIISSQTILIIIYVTWTRAAHNRLHIINPTLHTRIPSSLPTVHLSGRAKSHLFLSYILYSRLCPRQGANMESDNTVPLHREAEFTVRDRILQPLLAIEKNGEEYKNWGVVQPIYMDDLASRSRLSACRKRSRYLFLH